MLVFGGIDSFDSLFWASEISKEPVEVNLPIFSGLS